MRLRTTKTVRVGCILLAIFFLLFCAFALLTQPVRADSVLVSPTVTATPSAVFLGQTSVLSSTPVTTGTAPYTYNWYVT
ncbi:MAG: hypothetical protein ABSA79_05010, partial [Candidatus Bathyarchaeia archaeon]